MSDAASQWMPTLLAFPPGVRLGIAELLRLSVAADTDVVFRAELDRRMAAHDAGEPIGIPVDGFEPR